MRVFDQIFFCWTIHSVASVTKCTHVTEPITKDEKMMGLVTITARGTDNYYYGQERDKRHIDSYVRVTYAMFGR